ncbi:dialkylrecorsinol condensing enzyme [Eikenella sp. Marseille-P7795]|uniref:dialkylrecorsinol condensing enzyme n=1 Tax=Eikenella sp. Marseille-P7795 TaxID=2866577 RepID=UPI001CE3D08C|nr:dialkylrecorsinol condensing enzyme [Eikenella sp. Marseille-P7795]
MVKRVLVVSYSQSGQLARLKESFLRDWRGDAAIEVDDVVLRPQRPFAFPWRFLPFFDAFPETVHLQPAPIEPPELAHERYDLVVIAYSVWFLSPAPPVTAFLQSAAGRRALRDTPVITLIGCRNMWLMAQEKMKRLLADAGARLIGNVVKIDQCGSAASFITTPLWMFTGKRQAVPWLPAAGISEAEIADMARFGRRTAEALRRDESLDETLLQHMGAVKINEKLMASERVGHRSFLLWGRLVMAAGRVSPLLRRLVLCVYIVFLLGMILTVVPIGALLKTLLAPMRRERMRRERAYYAAPSGE